MKKSTQVQPPPHNFQIERLTRRHNKVRLITYYVRVCYRIILRTPRCSAVATPPLSLNNKEQIV